MSLSSRERLIRAAYELFYRHGFHAVGLDQIIKDAGVTKSTLYNHFDSKEALIVAVLEWRQSLWPNRLHEALRKRAGTRPRAQLMALFDVLDEVWDTDGHRGCLFIRAAAEFPSPHDPVHVVAQNFVRAFEAAINELAAYAGARHPKILSRKLAVLVAGAHAHSQVGDPVAAAQMGKRLAKRALAEHLPTPVGSSL
jgi:AcrR family transcriptional regulator